MEVGTLSLETDARSSLVVQWIGVLLLMQEPWVWSLIQEDSTCCGATKPMGHNCWACARGPVCCNYWSPHIWRTCFPTREATAVTSPQAATGAATTWHNTRKPVQSNEDPAQPKKKEVLKKEIACLKNAYSVIRYWVLIKYKPLDHQIECNGLLQSSCMPTSLRYENFYWSLFNRQVNAGLLKQCCKQRRKTNMLGFPYLLI